MNLLSGVLGVIFTLDGNMGLAFPMMLAAAVFDFCDGLAARALGAYSDIGKELDSLSDMVSFGVLPSLMLFTLASTVTSSPLRFLPLLLAVFSALRLAKFNIDERQHDNFIGLATPASAMICGSYTYFVFTDPVRYAVGHETFNLAFVIFLTVVLSALMVSEIPMFNMKFRKISQEELDAMGEEERKALELKEMVKKQKRIAFIAIVVIIVGVVACLGLNWSLAFFMAFSAYVLMNLIFMAFPALR
jgi:CDP-diacylglycerol--serine O-phosphatidyltransferase